MNIKRYVWSTNTREGVTSMDIEENSMNMRIEGEAKSGEMSGWRSCEEVLICHALRT